jgi:hypothetical protein
LNEENTKYLFDNFKFFRPKNPDSLMIYGFDCGDGWFPLIKELCEKLGRLRMPNFEVVQVKEKFATLSFYVTGVPERYDKVVNLLIGNATRKSAKTCEDCGKPGALRRLKWLMLTRCIDCFVNSEYGK